MEATLLDSETYLLICSRYIELNPVRAGMVKNPKDYPWSSYHFNALGKDNKLITPPAVYKLLRINGNSCQSGYCELFKHPVSKAEMKDIREATNKAWVLGSDKFKEKQNILNQFPNGI